MPITYVKGSIFDLIGQVQVIVNPVNCKGVMGKGLALDFKIRYPDMFLKYKDRCDAGALKIGRLHLWARSRKDIWILNFPTKDDWSNPSRLEYLEAGFKRLLETYKQDGITSIAFPVLGCGEGRLLWNDVQPLMERYIAQLEDVDVYIVLKEK